jgi:hypothetical protein
MKRQIQMLAFSLLGIIGFLFLDGCGKPHVLTFRAFIDGKDIVKISGDRLWVEHVDAELPAQFFVNGKAWRPIWTGKTSAPLEGLTPAFRPRDKQKVKLTQIKGRGPVSIIELPSADNEQTLAFQIDDPAGGADTYQISVTW